MGLKIFQTGDIHLGMKFMGYRKGIREELFQARFDTLEWMIEESNRLDSDLFVIGGDLFNGINVNKSDISKCVNILNKFSGACVLVLPGNHDYDNGVTDLWVEFSKLDSDKILLVNNKEYYSLEEYGLDATIYPAPCNNRHSKENSLGWIKEEGLSEEGQYHIGIAHGAIEGLSADLEGNYYSMGLEELEEIPTDLWLLGHTHVCYPENQEVSNHKVFNPGTPEPDGLNFHGWGKAWYIELDENGSKARQVSTGKFRFFDKDFHLNEDKDLEKVEDFVLSGDVERKLVRVNLEGTISRDAYEGLSSFYSSLDSKVFYLHIEDEGLKVRINKEIIEEEFTKGSFPYEFLNDLTDDEEALQIAYDLIRRD